MNRCPECGAQFKPRKASHRHCSRSCARRAWWRTQPRQVAVCEACAAWFAPPKPHTRFCSRRCAATDRRPPRPKQKLLQLRHGRFYVRLPDGRRVQRYRLVVEHHLGRALGPAELVHHRNGDPTDDRIENLAVVSRAEHIGVHRADLAKGL